MRFRKRRPPYHDLELDLRRFRPRASQAFADSLADQVQRAGLTTAEHRPLRRRFALRPALASLVTIATVGALAVSGEISYAATAVGQAASSFAQTVLPNNPTAGAANDQYHQPPDCRTKARAKHDAEVAGAQRAYERRLAEARDKRNRARQSCTTTACRHAADKAYAAEVATAKRERRDALNRAETDYLRLLAQCAGQHPTPCSTKDKAKHDAQVAAAQRAYARRLAAARDKRNRARQSCTTTGCRGAADKTYAAQVATAKRERRDALNRAETEYLASLRNCKP